MDERQIAEIVRRVVGEFSQPQTGSVSSGAAPAAHVATCAGGAVAGGRDGIFDDLEDAISAAEAAQKQLVDAQITLTRVTRSAKVGKMESIEEAARRAGTGSPFRCGPYSGTPPLKVPTCPWQLSFRRLRPSLSRYSGVSGLSSQ